MLYPMIFTPVLKDYIWGGRNLETKLGRALPAGGVIAESWEIAGHQDGVSLVENGPYAGWPLTELHRALGLELIGSANAWAQERGKFPLLVKLLDAHSPLSVQVHPDDAYALAHEGDELGKTEMWVVLHAAPGAELIAGVKAGTTPALFRRAIEEQRLEGYLHRLPVQTGDHLCVPAGTLHAIMGGLLIAEIQQNSNTTYRVYDWGRVDAAGQARPLHLDQALAVIDFTVVEPQICPPALLTSLPGQRRELLCSNRYFTTERITLEAGATFRGACTGASLEIWGVLTGQVTVNQLTLEGARFCLLPAALGPFTVTAASPATLLRVYTGGD